MAPNTSLPAFLKPLISLCLLASLAACSSASTASIANLYDQEKEFASGSWYSFSKACAAQLCPPN